MVMQHLQCWKEVLIRTASVHLMVHNWQSLVLYRTLPFQTLLPIRCHPQHGHVMLLLCKE
jgi:hypothetical protein